MKKLGLFVGVMSMVSANLFAVQADGANFCSDQDFSKPVKYIALKDANLYGDTFADGYIENAKIKGKKIKKGSEVKVRSIGKNCNGGSVLFMDIADDIGFTGVKASDFKNAE